MKLKNFIQEAIKDIQEAIDGTEAILGVRGVVSFDVAVVASEQAGADGTVEVWSVLKGKAGASVSSQVVTRLKFDIQTKAAINPAQSNPNNPRKNK